MNQEKALRRDFRVSRATQVHVERHFLVPGYRLVIPRKTAITPTGEFVLFRLRPPKGSDSRGFWARWDNAVVKGKPGPAVKVELDHPSARERLAFKRSLNGYSGHWTNFDEDTDKFHISIVDRGTPVFRGTLSLGLIFAVDCSLIAPGEVKLQMFAGGDLLAEVAIDALERPLMKLIKLEKRLRRQGRSARVARRWAMIAASELIPPSAVTVHRADPARTPKYTRTEKQFVLRRLTRRLAIAARKSSTTI